MSETNVAKTIVDTLEGLGCRCVRVHSGKVKVSGGWMQLARKGTPDWLVMFPADGYYDTGWLEIKKPGESLSPEQVKFHEWAASVGMRCRIAHSPSEAVQVLKDWRRS